MAGREMDGYFLEGELNFMTAYSCGSCDGTRGVSGFTRLPFCRLIGRPWRSLKARNTALSDFLTSCCRDICGSFLLSGRAKQEAVWACWLASDKSTA